MRPPRDAYPLELHLPGGMRAQLVPGSRPPVYTIDGAPTAIDVTIPEELAAAGWCWHGSTLFQPWAGAGDGPGVAITTCTFGVAGAFDQARRMLHIRAAFDAARAPAQLVLEL